MLVDGVGHVGLATNDLGCLLGQVGDHLARDALGDEFVESGPLEGDIGLHLGDGGERPESKSKESGNSRNAFKCQNVPIESAGQ